MASEGEQPPIASMGPEATTPSGTSFTPAGDTAAAGAWAPTVENVPALPISGTWVSFMHLKALSTARRGRLSDWALGAFLASVPGACQTLSDAYRTHQLPALGHALEVAIAFMSLGVMFVSLVQFAEPTSRDVLEQISREAAQGMGVFAALGRILRRWKSDFEQGYSE